MIRRLTIARSLRSHRPRAAIQVRLRVVTHLPGCAAIRQHDQRTSVAARVVRQPALARIAPTGGGVQHQASPPPAAASVLSEATRRVSRPRHRPALRASRTAKSRVIGRPIDRPRPRAHRLTRRHRNFNSSARQGVAQPATTIRGAVQLTPRLRVRLLPRRDPLCL